MTKSRGIRRSRVSAPDYLSRLQHRFWGKVDKTSGCWVWTGSVNNKGSGQIWRAGKLDLASRVSWDLNNGLIPPGLNVLHHCDNPACVRPDHLFLGTQKDNMLDCSNKGRIGYGLHVGEKNGNSRLTPAHVAEIRKIYAESNPASARLLARRFRVSQTLVLNIIHRKTWKHIP